MPKKMQLHIADPCHEQWDDMTEAEKGRFCASCQKQVIDFSEMSDREIVQFFKRPSTGSVCGRFMNDQLDRDMVIEKKRLPWIKYFFQFALPAFLLGKEAQAQSGSDQKPTTVQTPREFVRMGMIRHIPRVEKKTMHIIVKNAATGEPVPYASILVKGDEVKKVAGDKGFISINVDGKAKSVILTISSVGYKTKTFTRDISKDISNELLEMELTIDPVKMEEVVVVAKTERTDKRYTTGSVVGLVAPGPSMPSGNIINALMGIVPMKAPIFFRPFVTPELLPFVFTCSVKGVWIDPVAEKPEAEKIVPVGKTVPTIATTVYPNPVKRGESLTIELEGKTSEAIMVKLVATDGKTLIIHKQPISKGNNRFTINTDPAWTAGIYFLVFSNEKGILIKTEELLIQ